MTVSNKGRRKFKRTEVAWVARMVGEKRGRVLAHMDRIYRQEVVDKAKRGDPDLKTWCVVYYEYRGHGRIKLGLEMEAADMMGRLTGPADGMPKGARFARHYFREA